LAVLTGRHGDAASFDQAFGREIVRERFEPRNWAKPFEWLELGLRRFPAARRIMKRRGFREIHCGTPFPEGVVGMAAKKWLGARLVLWVLGEDAVFFRRCKVEAPVQRWMMRCADRVVAISNNTARICRELGATDANLRIVCPGVDLSAFRPDPEGAARIRSRHRVGEGPVLVTIGRLHKRKGHDKVMEALPAVRARFPAVKYLVVGDSTGAPLEDADELHRLAGRLELQDTVRFVGAAPSSELAAYYSAADLFVMPNRQIGEEIEGFGMCFLEAAACGRACVAGDSGGSVDAVRHEKTGLVVDGTDAGNVAQAIIRLLADGEERRSFEEAAPAWAAEFAWDRVYERFEAAIQ
jgi:phosphatidylinositol alpha-1,6-mannosyltransferase